MFPFLRRYEIFTSSIPLTNHRPPFQVSRECTHSHFPLARNRIGIGSLYSPRNFFHSIHTFSISRHLLVDRSIDRFRESGRLETLLPRIFSSKLLGRLRYGTRLRNGRWFNDCWKSGREERDPSLSAALTSRQDQFDSEILQSFRRFIHRFIEAANWTDSMKSLFQTVSPPSFRVEPSFRCNRLPRRTCGQLFRYFIN